MTSVALVRVGIAVILDAIAPAQNGCTSGWDAQVSRCFAAHSKSIPLMAGGLVDVQSDELPLAFQLE